MFQIIGWFFVNSMRSISKNVKLLEVGVGGGGEGERGRMPSSLKVNGTLCKLSQSISLPMCINLFLEGCLFFPAHKLS